MTTAHRSQLEARSGAKSASYIPTSTEHARLLPGHKTLKYRSQDKVQKNYLDAESEREGVVVAEDDNDDDDDDGGDDDEEEEEEEEETTDLEDEKDMILKELNKLRSQEAQEKSIETMMDTSHKDLEVPAQDVVFKQSIEDEEQRPKKRSSWRNTTTFSRKKVSKGTWNVKSNKGNGKYVNNITTSTYHQEFMKKIVK